MAGVFSLVAATTSEVAGAATTPVAASWSGSGPNCSSYVTATPPAGTVSATVTLNGGGGGGGNTNSGSGGTGGNGGQVTGTFALTHNTGAVSIKLGCGGSGGTTGGGGGSSINGASGGGGYAAGAASGSATDEDVSVDGIAAGGGGGAASGLCLGTSGCTTMVAVAAGGGGGGSRWDCTGSDGPGTGGAGESGGSSTVSAGTAGTAGGDGSSDGGGGGGGGTSSGGSGGDGAEQSGSTGGNTPTSSTGGTGGNGGGGFPDEAGASGGGGGGGYTGGGGGGGDECTSGDDTGGGGGGGSSADNSSYASSVSYNGNGGGGATTGNTGATGSVSLTWNVDNLSVTNPGTQSNVSGSAISNLTVSAPHDTTGGNTVTFAATGLPSGLSINSTTGVISGTPTAACACSATVTATDSEALSQNASFTWNVTNTVSVTNPGNQSSLSGTAIGPIQINASDTQSGATLTYSATGLPGGLTISSSGRITGTPAGAGSNSVTVTATDGSGYHGSATFTWTVTNTVSVTSPGNQSNLSGTAISPVQINATDTQSGATLTYSATGLPAGLAINSSTGSITGTPTTAGSSTVTAKATDGANYSGTATFTWTVTNTVSVTSPGNQSDVSGTAISTVQISATDTSSTATLTYGAGGTLPPGLAINSSTGAITGTPTTAGTYPVTVTVTDSAAYSAHTSFTWTVTNTLSVTNPGAQSDVSGNDITPLGIVASDSSSTATLTYSDGGTLPPGLSINMSNGIITGSPTIAGTYPVTITVVDSGGFSANAAFTWTITNSVSVTNPGSQSDLSGTAISGLQIQASDSLQSATLSYADNGTLPPGLSINPSTGLMAGTPTTAGTYPVTITVTDSANFEAQVSFTWTITNTVSVTNPGSQSNLSGSAISGLSVVASDSSSTATLSYADGGTLPPGLAINSSTGAISGTPTTAGSYSVTITVTDSAAFTGSASFTWTITNTVSVTNPGSQSHLSGSAISTLQIGATDTSSTATLSYADGGTLPPGLAINSSTGAISGTPTTAGSYSVTITVTDSAAFTGSASFTWTITNTVSVTNPGNQSNTVGTAISNLHIAAQDSSSTATLTYGVTGLPEGLSLDSSSGIISGIPLHSGVYPVEVTATDGAGFNGSASFTWTIIGPIVRSIKPNTGPGVGGTKVKIVGSDLAGATSVMFGSVEATSFSINKKGAQITAMSPSESAGTVDIVVTTPAGPTITTPADQFTFIGPTITAIKPSNGSVAGHTKVVITGKGFQGATASTVKFGPLDAESVVVNKAGTKITAYTPAEPVSTVNVTVTTPGGSFTVTNGYTFI